MFSPWDMQPYDQPGYPGLGYPGAGYPGPGYPGPGYPQPGYAGPGYPQRGFPHPAYARPAHPRSGPVQGRLQLPLLPVASGAFPVPESLPPDDWPPAVKAAVMRLFEGPPKPAVTPQVMDAAEASMIAPDLPNRSNV